MEKGRVLRRPHFLSNANTALQYLASKRIKLVNINPADLVDGRPPVVLGLIWTIILYFQVSESSVVKHFIECLVCTLCVGILCLKTTTKNRPWFVHIQNYSTHNKQLNQKLVYPFLHT